MNIIPKIFLVLFFVGAVIGMTFLITPHGFQKSIEKTGTYKIIGLDTMPCGCVFAYANDTVTNKKIYFTGDSSKYLKPGVSVTLDGVYVANDYSYEANKWSITNLAK